MKQANRYVWVLLILFQAFLVYGQEKNDANYTQDSIQIIQAKLIGNHPLGMYMMRLESDFRIQPLNKKHFSIQISSANVWEPLVTAYKPLNQSDKDLMNPLIWYDREYAFDPNLIPNERIQLQADAIIKGIQMSFYLPIDKQQELRFDFRSYLFTKGKIPFSLLSSDQFLEFFHSNIAGGEDPFARKYYGLDQVALTYIDEQGSTIEKKANDFVFAGLEAHYTYFIPSEFLANQDFYINLGAHLGINTNKYNPSSDLGLSASFIKQIKIKENKILQLASGNSISVPSFVRFGEAVNISNTKLKFTADWQVSYQSITANNNRWEIALNYHHLSAYQSKKDLDGIVLVGERISSHWHYAISHLYDNTTQWTLVFNYATAKYSFSVYATEDIKVNNAPDIQMGIQLSLPLH